jgi:hypothetical protein
MAEVPRRAAEREAAMEAMVSVSPPMKMAWWRTSGKESGWRRKQ